MSTRARQYRQQAEDRWPQLQQFLGAYLHQDWPDEHGDPEAAIDAAIADNDLDQRMAVCREWSSWNAAIGWQPDVRRSIEEGLGVEVSFEDDGEARRFMNEVYEKVIVSIRQEAGKDWKP